MRFHTLEREENLSSLSRVHLVLVVSGLAVEN
jgi:hypothetical protein